METTPRSRRDSSSSISSIGTTSLMYQESNNGLTTLHCTPGQGELIRVPSETITITKEKVSGGGRGPTISKERSRPSQGGSAQTSGQTTPTNAKPPRMLSEAALKVSASLLSHNDRSVLQTDTTESLCILLELKHAYCMIMSRKPLFYFTRFSLGVHAM